MYTILSGKKNEVHEQSLMFIKREGAKVDGGYRVELGYDLFTVRGNKLHQNKWNIV